MHLKDYMVRDKIYIIILIIYIFTCFTCESSKSIQKKEYYSNLEKIMKQNACDFYLIKNIYNHYPIEYSLDSIVSLVGSYSTIPLDKDISKWEYSYLILKDKEPKRVDTTIYTKYISFDLGFKDDEFCNTLDTNGLQFGKLPIPNIDFALGEQGLKFSQILFFEAKSGDYWKGGNNCERPSCLGNWKHGYTRGIGIYKDSSGWKKMYWVMYW